MEIVIRSIFSSSLLAANPPRDLQITAKSRYFVQPRPIIVKCLRVKDKYEGNALENNGDIILLFSVSHLVLRKYTAQLRWWLAVITVYD